MKKEQIPAVSLAIAGVYIALNRIVVYIGHVTNPPQTEMGYLAELVTAGFLTIAVVTIVFGVYSYRKKWVATPSAILVGTVISLLTFELRLYSQVSQNQSDLLIWFLITIPPTVGTWVILRSLDSSWKKYYNSLFGAGN